MKKKKHNCQSDETKNTVETVVEKETFTNSDTCKKDHHHKTQSKK